MLIAQDLGLAKEAGSNLLQYGAIGACLVIALIGLVILIRSMIAAYKDRIDKLETVLGESQKEVKRLNDIRVTNAVQIIELAEATNGKLEEQAKTLFEQNETMKKMHDRLGRILRKVRDTRSLENDDDS